MTTTRSSPRATKRVAPKGKKTTWAKPPAKLLVAMTGKASPAKAEEGDKPVLAYIASLPQPQRDIAERIDALAAKTLPDPRSSSLVTLTYHGCVAPAEVEPNQCGLQFQTQ